ncbi:MAG: FAD-binding oxidoreductase [Patescibacteria group bacterium]
MHTSTEQNELELYSTDSSIFKVVPAEIVYPQNIEDIKHIVKIATEAGSVISVRAGGTCMSGGSLTPGTIIDMKKYMNAIKLLPYSKSVDIEMGAYYRDLEAQAIVQNLMFAPYTSSKDVCGIGGMIGNNASGEKSIRYGSTVHNVHGVTVVLHDGEAYTFEEISDVECEKIAKQKTNLGRIYKTIREIYSRYNFNYEKRVGEVKKASSGYRLEQVYNKKTRTWNLAKLFVGSQGTLGVIVSARLKLVPTPVFMRTIAIPIDNLSALPIILQTVMRFNPEGVETFDVHTWEHAKQFIPADVLRIGDYFAHGETLIVLAQFSEVTQEATDSMAHACVTALAAVAPRTAYIANPEMVNSLWAVRRSSYKVLRDAVYDTPMKRAVPCIEDIIVPVTKYDIFIPRLIEILTFHKVEYGFHGHIGDGALRVIPIIDFTDKAKAIELIEQLCIEVFSLVKELDGNYSADHGDGIIRTPFLRDFYGDELFENVILGIKHLFDPHDIFNSGKKDSIQVQDWHHMIK